MNTDFVVCNLLPVINHEKVNFHTCLFRFFCWSIQPGSNEGAVQKLTVLTKDSSLAVYIYNWAVPPKKSKTNKKKKEKNA